MSGAKARYVAGLRLARRVAAATRLLGWADRRRQTHPYGPVAHIRSLLAIHDVEDMVRIGTPWWTYRVIAVVDAFLRDRGGQARVFEFGSGASTVWLAQRCAEVHSVEHDEGFASIVQSLLDERPVLAARTTLHRVPAVASPSPSVASQAGHSRGLDFSAYVATIERVGGPFDLVVVDGRAREACVEAAYRHLAPDGLVLLDDSYRRRYRRAIDPARWRVRRLAGLTPALPYPSETSLLKRQA